MRPIIPIVIFLCLFLSMGFAQLPVVVNGSEEPLKIGDLVPSHKMRYLKRSPTMPDNLKDFKGKLLILDFWATWCAWCIASIPELNKLQDEFGDRIQIVLVNDDEKETTILKFISRRVKITGSGIGLPIIFGDTLLTRGLFKHQGIPHVVWIGPDGRVLHITSKAELNSSNIQSVLAKQSVIITPKTDELASGLRDSISSFYMMESIKEHSKNDVWRSSLYKKRKGFPFNSILRMNNQGLSGIAVSNSSMIDMYRFAYGTPHLYENKNQNFIDRVVPVRTLLYGGGNKSYGMTIESALQSPDLYCYQLIAPPFTSIEKLLAVMRSDLDRYFGFRAGREIVKVKCLILTAQDTLRIGKGSGDDYRKVSDIELKVNNVSIDQLIRHIETNVEFGIQFMPYYPIVDETGFNGKLGDISVETDIGNIGKLDKAIAKYGLGIKLEDRDTEMLVIRRQESF